MGGVIAELTSPRVTYFITIPFVLASIVAFIRFDEPRLHRAGKPTSLSKQARTTLGAMRLPELRQVMIVAALGGVLAQTVFEFGPLWLVSFRAPAAAFGPYWAMLVASLGVGGYLTSKLQLDNRRTIVALATLLALAPIVLATSRSVIVIVAAQAGLQLLLMIVGIHIGLLLHDAVPSPIRAGVSSGVVALSWLFFLPFSIGFGWLIRAHGVHWAGWVLVGIVGLLSLFVVTASRRRRTLAGEESPPDGDAATAVSIAVHDFSSRAAS